MSFDPLPGLTTRALARVIDEHDVINSTNERAQFLAREGAPHGTCVVSRAQTAGRGRRGRKWFSPANTGIYTSFLIRPRFSPRRAPVLTLVTAVAVHEALLAAGVDARIKWPNDLLAGSGPHKGRKLCGILVELAGDASQIHYAVIGIGVNLREAERPEEIAEYATSLWAAGGRDEAIEPPAVLAAIANALEPRLDQLEKQGPREILERWLEHAAGLGERVEISDEGRKTSGVLRGIADDGGLMLETAEGKKVFHNGELIIPGLPRPLETR